MSETHDFSITLTQGSDYAFRIHFDDTAIPDLVTDEPAPLGGDAGPNPSRLLVTAVANCLAASLLFSLHKFRNTPATLTARARARLGRNEAKRLRVEHIDVSIALPEAAGTYQHLERLLAQFEDFCVVTESVRRGIAVDVSVRDGAGTLVHGPSLRTPASPG